ncbi:Sec-independent protein translocase protein TatB [Thiohalorhabdus sp.]|uniref:Sec-independent protein translocase protein TatB n=1 Tax=Thiohalorhabdus sp. TaxID=3094134 RepID=UPI002FC2D119
MFDIGFIEMLVVGLILLLVVGPERLPEVARTVGGWVHQAKQYLDSMKSELDQDLNFSELDRQTRQATETNRSLDSSGGDSGKKSGANRRETEVEADTSNEAAEIPAGTGEEQAETDSDEPPEALEAEQGGGTFPDVEEQAASDMERELEEDDEQRDDDHRG